jgi:hypothetical protein
MNEMNELEKRLLSWTPRRPSRELEARLFGSADAAVADELPSFRLGWLAPAALAALLMCVFLNQRCGAGLMGAAPAGPMVAMILSNQSATAFLTGSAQSEQNNLPADAFKWRGVARVTAQPAAFSPGKRDD